MTAGSYDIVVSGGGPAGAAAAWRAASRGARVLLVDKARFPREKPCGDGITPRAVQILEEIGLQPATAAFHSVDTIRVVTTAGIVERQWPARQGLPRSGYVVSRSRLDEMILRHAMDAGVDVLQGARVLAPLRDGTRVTGIRVRRDDKEDEFRAPVTIAADGMSSRLSRAAGLNPHPRHIFAVAMRAQVPTLRPDNSTLELFVSLRHGRSLLPGYGWAFPMGGGCLNLGIGYMSTYRRWRDVSANTVMRDFIASLPPEWQVPSVEEMVRQKQLSGWRLPMALAVWPPWLPGIMAAGDAVGAAKPFTGSGISKALESGRTAGDIAVDVLGAGTPNDLGAYEHRLKDLWFRYYQAGRVFSRVIGRPLVLQSLVEVGVRSRRTVDGLLTLSTRGRSRTGARSVTTQAGTEAGIETGRPTS